MTTEELIARERIRDALARYTHAGDRGQLDQLALCFAADGVLDLEGEPPIVGREAIRSRLASVVTSLADATTRPVLRHHVSSIRIALEGAAVASVASYFVVFTEIGLDHWGRYGDRFVREDGEWRIACRKVRVDGATPRSRMAAEHRVSP